MENHRGERMPIAVLIQCQAASATEPSAQLRIGFPEQPVSFFHGTRPPFQVLAWVDQARVGKMQLWAMDPAKSVSNEYRYFIKPEQSQNQQRELMKALRSGRMLELHIKDSGDSVGRLNISLMGFSEAIARCAGQ